MPTAHMNVIVRRVTAREGIPFIIPRVTGPGASLMISFTDRGISTGGEPFGRVIIRLLSGVDLGKAAFHPDLKFKPHETNFH